jgi:hypothetical protein
MRQLPAIITFFSEIGGFVDPHPLVSPHGPGYCYTTPTNTVLDGDQGIQKPGNGLFDICLSADKGPNGESVSGYVYVELYALNAFSAVSGDPTKAAGYRQVALRKVQINSDGITHYHALKPGDPSTSLTGEELAQLAVPAYTVGGVRTGGITLGIRMWNDPQCPNATTLKVVQYSAKLSVGP